MLIIDMQMPKCCARCFLADENDRCSILGTVATQKGRMPNCPIKGEISEIELMHLEEERAFVAMNIAAERRDDEQQ